NASIPTPQPVFGRFMFGAAGKAALATSITFISEAAFQLGVHTKLGLQKHIESVRNTRTISKQDMMHNDQTPRIDVDPETYEVRVDDVAITCEPAAVLPMAQRYYLF